MFIALLLALRVTRFLQRQRLVVDELAEASDAVHLPLRLKGVSSRLLRLAQPDIQKCSWKGALWSPSYLASSRGGALTSIVRPYIKQQQTPH